MDDVDLLRYSRHLLLDEFGVEGQARASTAHVVIVGLGGLGSPVALYLAAAGIARITLIDDDVVDLTNLQRQIVHTHADIGRLKAQSAADALTRVNPQVRVEAETWRVECDRLVERFADVSLLIDCSDNFLTRHAINAACVRMRVPLVSGSALRFDGQVLVFDARDPVSPCYACVFPPEPVPEETRCALMGVFSPLVGVIGTLQASEALKLICRIGKPPIGKMLLFNALHTEFETLLFARNPDCPVCGNHLGAHRHRRVSPAA
ncbi:MAG: HesA/MoeB/ThiF family protein [Comamonadaceae bacterium]|nr:MAG: HesA/MoeB/ThiF family protein [Comamonadaceae bacterium]